MRKHGRLALLGALLGILGGVVLAQAADSLTGSWDCKIDYGSGTGFPTFVLTQDGEKVTGTYKGALGDSKVTGNIKGDAFELTFNSNNIDMIYKGKIEGNKLSGTGDLGPIGKGPFSCTKK